MISFIKKIVGLVGGLFSSPTLLFGLGLAVLMGVYYVRVNSLEQQLKTAQSDQALIGANRDAWKQSSEQLAMLLVIQVEERQRAQDAAKALADLLQQDDDTIYTPLRQAIRAAPDSDDGPVAPVLARAIGALP